MNLLGQLKALGFLLCMSWLIWLYYRRKTFPLAERYSTFGPRFWTAFVDSCVLWPIGFFVSALLYLDVPPVVAALLIVLQSLGWLIYTVVLHARYGQTVGKMVTKVRVVDVHTEGQISWRQAWLREGIPTLVSVGALAHQVYSILTKSVSPSVILRGEEVEGSTLELLSLLPTLWFVAEVLTMLTNENRRALHDFIAGTVVVRTNIGEQTQPASAPHGTPPIPLTDAEEPT